MTFFHGFLHMYTPVLDNHQKLTFINCVGTRCHLNDLPKVMADRDGESKESMLSACHDDDIFIFLVTEFQCSRVYLRQKQIRNCWETQIFTVNSESVRKQKMSIYSWYRDQQPSCYQKEQIIQLFCVKRLKNGD